MNQPGDIGKVYLVIESTGQKKKEEAGSLLLLCVVVVLDVYVF